MGTYLRPDIRNRSFINNFGNKQEHINAIIFLQIFNKNVKYSRIGILIVDKNNNGKKKKKSQI